MAEFPIPGPVPYAPPVPDSRTLASMAASLRNATADCCGKAVAAFVLAAIKGLQDLATAHGEYAEFDNDGEDAPERPWQSFDNLIAEAPEKKLAQPVTVMADAKMALAALLVELADLINGVGKLPAADPLGHLARAPWRGASVVRLMVAVTARCRLLLCADPPCRDHDYPAVFRRKLEALVASKALIDPGADAVTRLFVDFVKVVAWHAAVRAYEHGRLTLNRSTFLSVIASMEAGLSREEAPAARDVLSLLRTHLDVWGEAKTDEKKAAAEKKAAVKAPAAGEEVKTPAPAAAPAVKAPAAKRPPTTAAAKRPPTPVEEVKTPAPAAGSSALELDYDTMLASLNSDAAQ